jgi:hypothetical protein
MYLNGFDQSRELRQKLVYGLEGETVRQALLRSLKHIIILQK